MIKRGWKKQKKLFMCCVIVLSIFAGIAGRFPSSETQAQCFDPALYQNPIEALMTPVLPNVLFIVDNSYAMRNWTWENGYDPNHQYPLYRYGVTGKCSGSSCSGSGNRLDSYYKKRHYNGYTGKVTNGQGPTLDFGPGETNDNNGAWYSYRNHDFLWDRLEYDSASGILQSGNWIYGRRTNEDNTWIEGEGWRKIRIPDIPSTAGAAVFTDNYLAYLFETYTSNTNPEEDLTVLLPDMPADTRMQVGREVLVDLLTRTAEKVKADILSFEGSAGCNTQISASYFSKDASQLISSVNGLTPSQNPTPLGAGLFDAYHEVFKESCEYECQNQFVIIITGGEPRNDCEDFSCKTYTTDEGSFESTINNYCDGDPVCIALKAEFGYSDAGFPWWNPCSSGTNNRTYLDGIAYQANRMTEVDPTWPSYGGQSCNPVVTYTIGFGIDHPLLFRTARAGDGLYFTAKNAEELAEALNAAMEDIFERTFSIAGLAFSSPLYRAGETKLISTRFHTADWSGNVISRNLSITWDDAGNVTDSGVSNEITASDNLPEFSSRTVYTAVGDNLVAADPSNIGLTEAEYNYLIGDSSKEVRFGCEDCIYRDRTSLFGDIIHSRPAVANDMVYVGGNDGLLHAIDLNSMIERWAFIPQQLVNRTVNGKKALLYLADPGYKDKHLYFVDLSVNVITMGSNTYLVGGFRGGGKGYFVMDVTDPDLPLLVWSRTDTDAGWENIGYSFSEPQVARILNGLTSNPVLVIGNGYGINTTGGCISDSLFIVDLAGGNVLYELQTGTASGGLSTPAMYGPNGWIRTIYAGDLAGNLWRFGKSGGTWNISKLYNAGYPITVQCNIGLCDGKPLIIGGTGRYLTSDDIIDLSANEIFAIRDPEDGTEVTAPSYSRALAAGERVLSSPEILYGRAFVPSFTPDQNPCAFGGVSNVYSFNFCPDTEGGDDGGEEGGGYDEQVANFDTPIISNLGTTGDHEGNTAVIAEDIDSEIHVLSGPRAPASLTGSKNIRWMQVQKTVSD